jgi:hypothetical protein
MNSNALIRILATFGLLIASLWVAFDIFTSGSNAVARFYMYAMIVAGVYGLLNARRGFYVLLFLTGYLDFFKRLMIFDVGVSRMDLYFVLGIAPATLSGMAGNILYQHFTGKLRSRPGINRLIIAVCLSTTVAMLLALTSGADSYRSLGDTVNATIYLLLLFVIPVIFRTPEELRRMLKILVILYIPAVAYMLMHHFRGGIWDWEMAYVKSGLTIEIRQLAERVFRPFGTMSSASNASMVFAGILALCFSGMWRKPDRDGRKDPFPIRFFLIPLIAVAMYATYSRTGWVFAAIAVIAAPMLKYRVFTIMGYALAIGSFVTMFVASGYLLRHKILNEWSEDIYVEKRTQEWGQATNLATLSDRLEGFESMMNEPRAWTPLGLRLSSHTESSVRSNLSSHDLFTDLLVKYGYLTMLAAGIIIAWYLWKLHRLVFYEEEPLTRSVAATCLAIGLATASGATVNGAQFSTYPVNFFIWFNFAVVASLLMYVKEREASREPVAAAEPPAWLRGPLRSAQPRPQPVPVPAHANARA